MPPKKNSKSPIKLKPKKGFKHHSIKTRQPNTPQVILQGIECNRKIYLAWLEYSGMREGEAYFAKPIDQAWSSTVMNSSDEDASPLYPSPPHKSNKSIIDIFEVDYWTERREDKGIERRKESGPGRGFPFKTFVWTRPTIEEDPEKGSWDLNDWLIHLKDELSKFMAWTRKNEETYSPFKYSVTIRTRSRTTITPLADEILDSSLIVVIRNMFEIEKVDDILNDTDANDSIRMTFFGPDVSIKEFKYRIKNAWNNAWENDEEE